MRTETIFFTIFLKISSFVKKKKMHKVWNDMRVGRKTIYISQTAQQVQTQNANLQLFNNVTTFPTILVSPLLFRVIYKLLASKSESIRVQALKVLGYFLKHLGHKWVLIIKTFVWRPVYEHTKLYLVCWHAKKPQLGHSYCAVNCHVKFFHFNFLSLCSAYFWKSGTL